jgi:hypothetical protein
MRRIASASLREHQGALGASHSGLNALAPTNRATTRIPGAPRPHRSSRPCRTSPRRASTRLDN